MPEALEGDIPEYIVDRARTAKRAHEQAGHAAEIIWIPEHEFDDLAPVQRLLGMEVWTYVDLERIVIATRPHTHPPTVYLTDENALHYKIHPRQEEHHE